MMKRVLGGLTTVMILTLAACGSLKVQGEVMPAAEATQQVGRLSPTELQVSDKLGDGIDTPDAAEATRSLAVTPTSIPSGTSAPNAPADHGTGMSVVDWSGYVIGLPAGSQFDDYFMLAGDNPTQYGIDSALADPSGERELADEIEALRDSGKIVHIWGEMTCGAMDVGGCQIVVWKLDADGTIYEITPMPATP